MKHNHKLMMIVAVAILLTGCGKKQQTTEVATSAPDSTVSVKTESEEPSEKLVVKTITRNKKDETGEYKQRFDFPQSGNAWLVNAIREYISESLGTSFFEEDISTQGSYSGDLADGEKMADYYFNLKMKDFSQMHKEMKEEGMPDVPELASDIKITREYETDKVVTYTYNGYSYGGGAHGSTTSSGMTFRKSDGRRIGWDLFTARNMQTVLREGLKTYFEVKTDEELTNCLTLSEPYVIPMPVTPPIFGKDGVIVMYQQYEIAAYAAGMPTFTIPYNKVKPMLNNTGKNLL